MMRRLKRSMPVAALLCVALGAAANAREIIAVGVVDLRGVVERCADAAGGTTEGAPRYQALGTASAIRLFCGGVGVEYPDILATRRPLRPDEVKACQINGVEVREAPLGIDVYVTVKVAHLRVIEDLDRVAAACPLEPLAPPVGLRGAIVANSGVAEPLARCFETEAPRAGAYIPSVRYPSPEAAAQFCAGAIDAMFVSVVPRRQDRRRCANNGVSLETQTTERATIWLNERQILAKTPLPDLVSACLRAR